MIDLEPDPKERVQTSLERVLEYSEGQNYSGHSKFDALNSPALEFIFGKSYYGRLLITQLVNRSYLPIRLLLGVRKSRNPKGIANFLKAYCNLYRSKGREEYLVKSKTLADWLLANHSNQSGKYQGLCWGYNFPWQSPGFFAPRFSPNCIVTVFCAEGLLETYQICGENRYLEASRKASEFILRSLPVLEEDQQRKCIGYVPEGLRWKVININAVSAGFLAKLGKITNHPELLHEAKKMIQWVVDQRTDYFAWYYTVPPSQSGIGHDNYHTGGILDGILDYQIHSEDSSFETIYLQALEFYRDSLFTRKGAPKWTSAQEYPYDIHGTAQGILSFAKASRYASENLSFALKLADWGIRHMQDLDGHFYYREHRFFTRKECLMRWNNSWMSWALSELLLQIAGSKGKN